MGNIYKITNTINGKSYIGATTKSIEERFNEHIYCSNNGSNTFLHKALRKHGEENFTVCLILECDDSVLFEKEKEIIYQYGVYENGYNLTLGGEGAPGVKWSDDSRKKMSEIAKRRPPVSKETRDKMSKTQKNRVFTEEHRRRLSESQKGEKNHRFGKKHSEESKRILSEMNKGERNHFFGKTHSEDTRKMISEKLKNRFSGKNNPAARPMIYGGKKFDTGKDLRKSLNMPTSRYYKLLKEGIIQYEDQKENKN